jgi:tetratricopeptide (TPR) repeat protein
MNDDEIERLIEIIESNPDDAEAYYNRGIAYYDIKDYNKAINDYSKAIELNPDDAKTYFYRGNAYGRIEDYDKAINDFSKAIELNPDYAEAYNNRGNAYNKIKNYNKAINDYSKAIELNPDLAVAYNNRGVAYAEIEDYDKAINDYSKAIELNPDDAKVYYNRGHAYNKIKDYNKAINDYSKAIELNPDYADTYNNRGNAYVAMEDYDKAINDYSKAIELNPDYAETYYNRGHAYSDTNINNIYTDWNTYIYLLIIQKREIENISRLTSFFAAYPQTVKTVLNHAEDIYLDRSLINSFEDADRSINDFTVLLNYYKHTVENTKFLGIRAVLLYFMGGSIESFMVFDEQLDNDEYKLSSQELYYYALTSKEINRDAETVLINSISNIEQQEKKETIDCYYLGHLYLLRGYTDKSVECFEQSKNFIFSAVMLTYLQGNKEDMKVIDINNMYNFPTTIDYKKEDLSQFQSFIHIHECEDAIRSFWEIPEEYSHPFWEIFQFSDKDRITVELLFEKAETEIIIENIRKNFSEILEEKMSGKEECIEKLEKLLPEIHVSTRNIYDTLEEQIAKGRDFENQIGLEIEAWTINNPQFYTYLLQLYYLRKLIDSRQVFALYFYLIYTIKKNKSSKLNKGDLILEISKIIVPHIGIKLSLVAVKTMWNVVKKISNGYEEFEKLDANKPSDFRQFKENFWRHINDDRNCLSEEAFERKYRCFEWFETK